GIRDRNVTGVQTCALPILLPDSPDVAAVLAGKDGVFASARPGTLVIDFSSIRPDVSAGLAADGKARGLRVLDAPVSGGEQGAIRSEERRVGKEGRCRGGRG